jgi:ABC-type nitrate/sulfonate/bicarbonate transport system ATPase subunit
MATRLEAPHQEPRDVEGDVQLEGVTRRFGDVVALEAVALRAAAHEVVAVVGPSGSGKSTLLELVCGLQAPDAGRVTAGRAVLMPQRDLLLPWLDALDNAALPLRLAGVAKAPAREQAHTLLTQLGLDGFERSRTWELSGGMRQRVAVARTLLSGAPILCLDEPFGALDAITRADAQGWLAGVLAREPRTVLLVTHDVEEAVLLADRVVVLSPRPGRVVADLAIGLPRPRSATDPAVTALRARALDALRGAMEGGA